MFLPIDETHVLELLGVDNELAGQTRIMWIASDSGPGCSISSPFPSPQSVLYDMLPIKTNGVGIGSEYQDNNSFWSWDFTWVGGHGDQTSSYGNSNYLVTISNYIIRVWKRIEELHA